MSNQQSIFPYVSDIKQILCLYKPILRELQSYSPNIPKLLKFHRRCEKWQNFICQMENIENKENICDSFIENIKGFKDILILYTEYLIKKYFSKAVEWSIYTISSNNYIVRGREGKDFKIEDLRHKPAKYNTTYQRASTPYQTMFYGTYVFNQGNEKSLEKLLTDLIYTAFAEINPIAKSSEEELGNNIYYGIYEYTFGCFIIEKELRLLNLTDSENQSPNNPYIKILIERFEKKCCTELDYLFTAIFTEKFLQNDSIDGIIYKSVRANNSIIEIPAKYFNIALKPQNGEDKLKGDVIDKRKFNYDDSKKLFFDITDTNNNMEYL